jgi:uncharacterized protein (DUF58 family)
VSGEPEFHGVREYRQGDNPRWIHWRRSARTGQLVIREHTVVHDSQLIVVLDPWPSPGTEPGGRRRPSGHRRGAARHARDPRVERLISAAATALCEALDRGHRVGLICRAAVPIIVAPAGGRAHRQRLLNELALIGPGRADGLDQLIAAIRWSTGWNARCLLFVPGTTDLHARAARMLGARAESLTVISPQTGSLDKLFDIAPAPDDRRAA